MGMTANVIDMVDKFQAFPKIKRYANATITITEKLDGTNAALVFDADGELYCQSRNRIITPGKQSDNQGFATWAYDHQEALFEFFGPGRHFGEWWGVGIGRGYGQVRRWFSPFNTHIFHAERHFPEDCRALPVLAQGAIGSMAGFVADLSYELAYGGSKAAPGFMDPEGLMIYCDAFGYLKVPFDAQHKWAHAEALIVAA